MAERLVAGKYEIYRRIGAGGMGVVYEATEIATHRRVALKILSPSVVVPDSLDLSDSMREKRDELVARFEREARSMAAIRSEHVVEILEAGTDLPSGRPFMAMELLRGDDLGTVAKRLGPLSPDLSLRIAAQTCVGLGAAHRAGVIHRDIKSANLYLARRGGDRVVKILDFGIAKIVIDHMQALEDRGLTHTGSMLGSPQYMSPEQVQGLKTIDHRADIWSLGVVLYRCLTGTTPFEAESVGQLILAICSSRPRPIEDLAPWLSPGVAAIVHKALRRDPEDRYASADAMLAAIKVQLPAGWEIEDRMVVGSPERRAAPAAASDALPRSERTPTRTREERVRAVPEATALVRRPPPRTVMIVDDSSTLRSVLKVYLAGREFEFVEAGTGLAALDLLRVVPVDLVIADINMPRLDGIQFVRRLRAAAGPSRHAPVIVVTGEKSAEIREQALGAGANEVLRKPVTSEGLVEVAERLLATRVAASR